MARVHPFQTNFTAGELSPRLAGQIDFKKYNNGCSELTNMYVFPHGGARRRGGSHFVREAKYEGDVRLIPFEFNVTQAYVLEFGSGYVRFYKDNGVIVTTPNSVLYCDVTESGTGYTSLPTIIIDGNATGEARLKVESISKTASGSGYTSVPRVVIGGNATAHVDMLITGGAIVEGGTGYSSAPTIEVVPHPDDKTGCGATATATVSGGAITAVNISNSGSGYTLQPTFNIVGGDSNAELEAEMGVDTITLDHGGYDYESVPSVSFDAGNTKVSASATVIMELDKIVVDGGSDYTETPTVQIVGGGGGGATATAVICGDDGVYEIATPYAADELFELYIAQSADVMYICHSAHPPMKLSRTGHTSWSLDEPAFTWAGLNPWTAERGYPRSVTFYEQRLFFAGTSTNPQTIWASKTADYENFDQGTGLDDEAMEYAIATNKVNVVRWLQPSRDLIVGTVGGEFKLSRPAGQPLTPSNVMVTQQTTYGSHTLPPVQVGNAILMVQRARRRVREFSYNYQNDAYIAPDMTLLAEHITEGYIKDMDYQQEPDSILWSCLSTGELLSMTYERPEDVVAWSKHELGGDVESVAVIDATTADQVWLVVNRDGARCIEYIDPDINVDSGLTGTVSGDTQEISGLDHLEDETVSIVINGAVFPTEVVVNGVVSPEIPDSWIDVPVEVGLGYVSTLRTMRVEAGSQAGKAQGRRKRWNEVFVRVCNTTGITVNGEQRPFRTSADLMGQGIGAFTGDLRVTNLGWDTDGIVEIKQEQPLDMVILGIHGTLNTVD